MRRKSFPTLILHFDETYFYQDKLRALGVEVDLRDIPETRYMCSFENLEKIEKRIPKLERSINFLGRGDYHYLTYLFVKRINIPFVLIVLDHHGDIKETFENYISCGSWILEAVKLENVRKIIFIDSKVSLDCERIKILVKDMPLYISIDKDVLDKSYINTSWDQGDLSLPELLSIFSLFSQEKILGVDICGEPAFNIFEYKRSERINLEIWRAVNRVWDYAC